MRSHTIFKKTILSGLIASIGAPSFLYAAPYDLSQLPPGITAIPPTPNVIVTVDDSGSMNETINGDGTPKKITALKDALKATFNDKLLLPDGKIRLAWQVMHNNGNATDADSIVAGKINSMKLLNQAHRDNFLAFADSLDASGGTPSHKMMKQAYDYMKTGKSINSPWAFNPGKTEEPYLGCRRAYHIFMTDGGWNGQDNSVRPGNIDNKNLTLPDAQTYSIASEQTNVYRGAVNSLLADWAMKMWAEDLQPDIPNDIKPSTTDGVLATETHGAVSLQRYWNPKHNPARWQHLVQYTIGYGSDAYSWPDAPAWDSTGNDDNYGGDYSQLVQGNVSWVPSEFGNLNKNNPAELWHMAINSRGKFYPTGPGRKYDLPEAFRKILENINIENSANVADMGANSSTNMRTDINRFVAGYDPKRWSGYVYADHISTNGTYTAESTWGINAGLPAPKDRKTTAQILDARASIATRVILTTNDSTNAGVSFEWASDASKLSAAQKALLNGGSVGERRLNFLRGDRTYEEGTVAKPFRVRDSRQGDIVNSTIWYTGSPASNYAFKGYKAFTQANRDRLPMVYVGGNDGMLHGFSVANGEEKIAYVPKAVYPNLADLSNPSYSHKYYVDGSPFTGDIDDGPVADRATPTYAPNWKTMLVGTLGAGGRGYFVLNVTQPGSKDGTTTASEFTTANAASLVVMDKTIAAGATVAAGSDDEDFGHIFTPPVLDDTNQFKTTQIVQLNNSRWAAVMGNGYNSKNERPVLLIQYLDGAKELKKIVATGTQTVSTPINPTVDENVLANGLSAPRTVDINGDGKADIVYAGDLKGNLWKFDLTSSDATNWDVATFAATSSGTPTKRPLFTATYTVTSVVKRQPIFAAPVVKANDRGAGGMMVAFGTGLNITDAQRELTDVQSVYSVLDNTRYKKVSTGITINTNTSTDKVSNPDGVGAVPLYVSRSDLVAQTMTATTYAGAGVSSGRDFWKMSSNAVDYSAKKGWYFDLPVSSERVLRPLEFFDSSNNLMIFSLTPAYGGSATQTESCEPSGTSEKAYLTLMNIMDGKPPSIQVMDQTGDGVYSTSTDNAVSRMKISAGATNSVTGQKVITLTGSDGKKDALARMPEQPFRPLWRQLQ